MTEGTACSVGCRDVKNWITKIAADVGLFLLLPLTAPAVTTQAQIPGATVEQATFAYDGASVRVVSDNVFNGSETPSEPFAPSFAQVAELVAAKSGVQAYEVGTADALRARSVVGDALDIHHVGQATPLNTRGHS